MSTEEEKFCKENALEIYNTVLSKLYLESKRIEACMMSLRVCIAKVESALDDVRDNLEKLVEKK